MRPIEIKHALEMAGFTQADIARQRNKSPASVNRVIKKRDRSEPTERLIAQLLGLPVEAVWPEYYVKMAS